MEYFERLGVYIFSFSALCILLKLNRFGEIEILTNDTTLGTYNK